MKTTMSHHPDDRALTSSSWLAELSSRELAEAKARSERRETIRDATGQPATPSAASVAGFGAAVLEPYARLYRELCQRGLGAALDAVVATCGEMQLRVVHVRDAAMAYDALRALASASSRHEGVPDDDHLE